MKKSVLLLGLAALALSSCSNDETTAINSGNAIDFRAAMGTRGTETTNDNLTQFKVTALDKTGANYFTGAVFTKEGSFFTSTPAYYWPADNSNLTFYAYAPTTVSGITINNTTKKLVDFAPAARVTDQIDFVTANATGSKADESAGVHLEFAHRLSQIEVKAKNTNEGYIYTVTGVRIAQIIPEATFDFADEKWAVPTEDVNDKATYDVTYADAVTLGADAVTIMGAENDNAMLIPQQLTPWDSTNDKKNADLGAYLAVRVQINTKDGARVFPTNIDYAWVAVPIDTNWEQGNKYIYTLDFSAGAGKLDPTTPDNPEDPEYPGQDPGDDILGAAIKFTVDVTAWTPADKPTDM